MIYIYSKYSIESGETLVNMSAFIINCSIFQFLTILQYFQISCIFHSIYSNNTVLALIIRTVKNNCYYGRSALIRT